ncbi:MAG: sugar ABC transporter ATP-binding protein [Anaerolineales bacterium]|nr:sugar ABC transporter ATP-binding protein [Anaerolineales bacterium]
MQISLSAQHVTKRYGGVTALSDGTLAVASGEVVALVGANGSGKSTLSKIITGVVTPDGGELILDGQPVTFAHPHAARARGITAVYQELSLIPDMSIAENIWLTHEPLHFGLPVNRRATLDRTRGLLDQFAGVIPVLDPETPVKDLTPDAKQIVEILKTFSLDPRFIILDEATASLDSQQVNRLFDLIEQWKRDGRAIVFVSHRMEEVFRIADRIVVMRNGQTVGDLVHAGASEAAVVALMTGESADADAALAAHRDDTHVNGTGLAAVRLQVRTLTSQTLRDVSFDVHDGELLGLGGLRGQGQEDILLAVFGAIRHGGAIEISGRPVQWKHPKDAVDAGVAYVPGDRNTQGLLAIRSILENLQLPSWAKYGFPLRTSAATRDAGQAATDLSIVMAGLEAPVNSLSGGNAQKVVIGKWLLRNPRILLLNDPTKGVDVGAKAEIYRLLGELRQAGTAIVFYSSDDAELLGLCDRVLVLHDGVIRAELVRGDSLTRSNLIAASVGASHGSIQ